MKLDKKPLVTFSVVCYKAEEFIEESVISALEQTYEPLEIIISDDCSPDNTFQIIEKIVADYQGSHKVILNRNDINLGLAGNINRVWELASGEFLVSQAGDDISLPHRTSVLVNTWLSKKPSPDLVYSGVRYINERGDKIGEQTDVALTTPLISGSVTGRQIFVAGGCAAAYSRELHWKTGPLGKNVIAEDFVYSFRAMLGNGIIGIPEPLVLYRQNSESIIGKLLGSRLGDQRILIGEYNKLIEYKKAMDAYEFTNLYLRWRLNRRIKTYSKKIQIYGSDSKKRFHMLLWAFLTGRINLFVELMRDAK